MKLKIFIVGLIILLGASGLVSKEIKTYHENGKLKYQGEFKDDQAHGKGKAYHENGKLLYAGEFRNDQAHGKGKEYYENGKLKYAGQWKNLL